MKLSQGIIYYVLGRFRYMYMKECSNVIHAARQGDIEATRLITYPQDTPTIISAECFLLFGDITS